MRVSTFVCELALASFTYAAAAPAPFCLVQNTVIVVLQLSPSARSFCSSFLGIKTQTSTTTQTVTPIPVTNTVTGTETTTDTLTTTSTVFSTPTTTVTTRITSTSQVSCGTASSTLSPYVIAQPSAGGGQVAARQFPIPIPPIISDQPASFVSSACSCLSIPTPTTTSTVTTTLDPVTTTVSTTTTVATSTTQTVTTTSTVATVTLTSTVNVVQPTVTRGAGLQFYQFTNDYDFANRQTSPFRASRFQANNYTRTGLINGLRSLNTPANSQVNTCTFPGETAPRDCQGFTLVNQGFFYAPQSGTYRFTATNIDDVVALWVRDVAYSGYTNDNALLYADFVGRKTQSATIVLTGGTLTPVTLMVLNGRRGSVLNLRTTFPNGTSYDDIGGLFIPPCSPPGPFSP